MLAARDQENLVHGHHTTAAAKPLNQGVRTIAPKTPGNRAPKTPFKLPLNDENATTAFGGKTVGKVKGLALRTGEKKDGKEKNAFVTPLDNRIRAPLGLKTTNAKTKAFQTPAPPGDDGLVKDRGRSQQRSISARKLKPRVSHAEKVKVDFNSAENQLEEREIEYMPPKPVELPDYPEDFPHDMTFPQFENGNLTRGMHANYFNPVGEDGLTAFERRTNKQQEQADEEMRQQLDRMFDDTPLYGINVPEFEGDDAISRPVPAKVEEKARKTVSTTVKPPITTKKTLLSSKGPSAASLLAKPANATTQKAAPNPTAAAAKRSSSVFSRKKPTPPPTNPSPMRHTALTAASRNTLGYSKGRAISSVAPRKPSSSTSSTDKISSGHEKKFHNMPPLYTAEEWRRFSNPDLYRDDGFAQEDLDLEPGMRGLAVGPLERDTEAEEDFELKW
ncbi:MAG: hypothetical protein M1817_001811 [Caeruleum heppii]|nr:MAG: hypothetical protein M1817_001811 [Caeruleum heppii]